MSGPLRGLRSIKAAASSAISLVLLTSVSLAQAPDRTADDDDKDRFDLTARSTTHLQFFQRALLPGTGAIVETQTLAPIHEYVMVRAVDIDGLVGRDSLDFEVSAWQRTGLGEVWPEERFDGDVTTANVRQRVGPAYLRLGRQFFAGGAARLAHFDGASAGFVSDVGFGADAYGGYQVLPRWSERPSYRYLGSAAESHLRSPDALPEPSRTGHWLAGGRLHYTRTDVRLGASFHEQRERSELGRRDVGLDALATPTDWSTLAAAAVMDVDSRALVDARLWADFELSRPLFVTTEYVHSDPSLFLSRQSVLAVFGTEEFDEAGAELTYRPTRRFSVAGAGYVELFDEERGTRARLRVRGQPDRADRLDAQLVYARVDVAQNGYHSLRASLGYRITHRMRATLDQDLYLYDEPIRGRKVSAVETATIGNRFNDNWQLLLGGSALFTPYSALDVQGLARVVFNFEVGQEHQQ